MESATLTAPDTATLGQSESCVAIIPFVNASNVTAFDWLSEAIASDLAHHLKALAGIRLADKDNLEKILAGLDESPTEASQINQLADSARLVGADTVITGTFVRQGDTIELCVEGIMPPDQHCVELAHAEGKLTDLFRLESEIAREIVSYLNQPVTDQAPAQPARVTQNLQAKELMVRSRRAFADANYRDAIRMAQKALEEDPDFAEPLSVIGAAHARLGEYDQALEHHRRLEQKGREADSPDVTAEAVANIGVMHYYQGHYTEALIMMEKAIFLDQTHSLGANSAHYRANMGFFLMRLDRLEEAQAQFEEALELSRQRADLVSMVQPLNGMGEVLFKRQKCHDAMEYYRRAAKLSEEIRDRVNVGVSHMNIGRCACFLSRYREAALEFDIAHRELKKSNFYNGLTILYENMADMFLVRGRTTHVLEYVEKRIELARKHNNEKMEADAWEQKARVHDILHEEELTAECILTAAKILKRPADEESLSKYRKLVLSRKPFGRP